MSFGQLLPSHRKELEALIASSGIPLSSFHWSRKAGEEVGLHGSPVAAVLHTSGYFFAVAEVPTAAPGFRGQQPPGWFHTHSMPGSATTVDQFTGLRWHHVVEAFKTWLTNLSRELAIPTLQLPPDPPSADSNDGPKEAERGSVLDVTIAKFIRALRAIRDLRARQYGSPEHRKWERDTRVALRKTFGENSNQLLEFASLFGSPAAIAPARAIHEDYVAALDRVAPFLRSIIDELRDYGLPATAAAHNPPLSTPLVRIQRLCDRFPQVAHEILKRHENRSTLAITDEYDVQDLMRGLLRVDFDDIRDEEYTPSYAGGASRMDFLLKAEQVVLETKMTRPSLTAKKLGEELLVDIARYATHPDCKILVCFVYDPEGRIHNPRGVEADLQRKDGSLQVIVIIRP
jgi:hypothetical protein